MRDLIEFAQRCRPQRSTRYAGTGLLRVRQQPRTKRVHGQRDQRNESTNVHYAAVLLP